MPFEIALTGLNAATADLEVISNNVANANTTGFKSSRAEFGDVYAVTSLGTSQNAIGKGVHVSAITQQFTQGNIAFTDNNLDLSVSGSGFFRLSDNGAISFSRAGAFGVDQNGFVVNSANQRLTGFLADTTGTITGAIGDLQIDTTDQSPSATTSIDLGANLDASEAIPPAFAVLGTGPDPATFNHSTSTTVFDSLGASHVATMYYRKDAANQWETFLFVDNVQVDGPDTITFNNDGSLNQINGASVTTLASPAFNPGGGAANMTVTMDYADLTQYGSSFGVNSLSQDGFATGRLSAVDVDDTGVLLGRYTNGQSRAFGQVVLSDFANVQGLRPLGQTGWGESFESGPPLVGAPNSATLGLVQSGALEESNVDITKELVDMITAQRNYQANAQVISTADTITQTIINIR